ncbi:MAG: hypothetical protein NTV71_02005, partial [Candidatus Omnitrophica bacterium]|nr:hypothetical protein [Candidatus Omnitrophota bacterium]
VVIINPRTKQIIFTDPITGRFDKSALVYKTSDGKILLVTETETGKLMAWELSATEIIPGSWSMAGYDTAGTSRFPGDGTPVPDLKMQFLPLLVSKSVSGAQEAKAHNEQKNATLATDIGIFVNISNAVANTYNPEDFKLFLSSAEAFLLKFLAVAGPGLKEKNINIEFNFLEGSSKVAIIGNTIVIDPEIVFLDNNKDISDFIAQLEQTLKDLGIDIPPTGLLVFITDTKSQRALQTSL